MKPDELKSLVETLSNVIDARAKTTESIFKAEIKASKEELRAEIRASEERTKEELRAEILAARAEAKADYLHLAGKVDRIARSTERRLSALEETTESPNPEKH